jgi:general secretion pathway protein D
MNDHILARLQLMESQDKVEVLATPMLLASNNTPARLFIGEERILTTGLDSTVFTTEGVGTRAVITPETEQRDIGNTLLIVPSVNSDRTVTLRIQQDTSTVSPKSSRIPVPISDGTLQEVEVDTVNTANIEGTVIARDGLTVAVGGMIRTTATDNEQRVPLLGSVPVLGQLFRRDVRSFKRSEMVLLITPHVFATPEEAQATTKDRMADLLDPSSSVNVYLDSGRTEAPRPDQERPRLGRGGEKKKREVVGQYATLTRFAMLAMRQPETPFPAEIDLMPIPDPESAKALIDANSVKVEPLAAWQGHGHYVTALRLANLSASELRLQQNHLRGKWRAITFEDTTLEPAGKLGDSTMAYVVSSLPFSQALGAKP